MGESWRGLHVPSEDESGRTRERDSKHLYCRVRVRVEVKVYVRVKGYVKVSRVKGGNETTRVREICVWPRC